MTKLQMTRDQYIEYMEHGMTKRELAVFAWAISSNKEMNALVPKMKRWQASKK